ncbi:hypothetical protein AZA_83634 [Nitrospirillum viridazoti Y2]|uniref:Uncharacterized protein DUF2867 n=1 Tax=Nitrospirillum amazonense TaxID=28077 RepID=A0A560IYJ6_9PROT|nr:DUF2867 domain-containing protein [Nitrospirillum amazonense]EGY00272.1 hypothetical protein AZA_83634 [Nitrospirillum amazonense Y2]TWB63545.1 uncharacterized protein DUF2867 [Nitrospirillum amazonense]
MTVHETASREVAPQEVAPHEVTPAPDTWALLPGAQFADAFRLTLPSTGTPVDVRPLDALTAAQRMMGTSPTWVRRLMALRNAIVAPLGLKAPRPPAEASRAGHIGIFPILSSGPDRVVLGMADKHLDFRAVVDVRQETGGCQVTATTVVRTHNWLGRAYLTLIMPFHRLVVRTMLGQVTSP